MRDFYKEFAETQDKLFQEKDVIMDPYTQSVRKRKEEEDESSTSE
jgi:hypothetical protein